MTPRIRRRRVEPALGALGALLSVVLSCACGHARAGLAAEPTPADAPAGEPVEPPVETEDGADVELEAADSIATGSMEVGFGASGRDGAAAVERRRVRLRDRDLSAEARDGSGDPLAGSVVRAGPLTLGRFVPRWGCGLVAGTPDDPWRSPRGDALPLPRGRSVEGAAWRGGTRVALEVFGGRLAKRALAGARIGVGGARLGVLAAAHAPPLASVSLDGGDLAGELAMDPAGRWRAEGGLRRPFSAATIQARVRAGLPRLGPPPEPRRAVPAQALTVALTRHQSRIRMAALGALWRFRPGLAGARGALAVQQELAHHQRLAVGFEEQRGRRRDAITTSAAGRQGLWGEWRGGPPGLRLALRSEAWGEGPWARREVRRASFATIELAGPARTILHVAHGTYRTRSGESLYLAEAESDRMVLRALTGRGERTRVDVTAPLAEGRARAALGMTATADRPPRLQWTVDWTRRLSTRRPGGGRARAADAGPDPEEDR